MGIIDLHCDTIYRIFHEEEKSLAQNSYSVDIQKLKAGDVWGQFFALYMDKAWVDENHLDIYQHTKDLYRVFCEQIKANQEDIQHATSYRDLQQNRQTGKISAFLTVEEGEFLQGKIQRLEEFYELGVRLITLTWNYENCIGYPNSTDRELMAQGLKPFGFEVVERMNQLGMIIDVSHLSDGGFYDCIEHSRKPLMASHSCARSLVNVPRNMTDDMLRALGEKGGMVGINFAPHFLGGGGDPVSRVQYMIEHIKHIQNVAGVEAIGLGTDFDGIEGELEIKDIGDIHKLVNALEQAGFHPDEIEKICSKNAERIIKECIG